MKVEDLLAEGGTRGLGRAPEVAECALAAKNDEVVLQLITCLRNRNRVLVHRAARALKKVAERRPELLANHAKVLLGMLRRESEAMQDVRTRWQMTIVLGCLPLTGRTLAVAVDLLFERLQEDSPLQKTFAMQALFNLSAEDEVLRARVLRVIERTAEDGTAAMRARARRLLRAAGLATAGERRRRPPQPE